MSYCQSLQLALQNTSFSDPNCNSWWKRDDGIITNNWAGTAIDYQKNLSAVNWADYNAVGSASHEIDALHKTFKLTKIGRVHEETRLSRTALGVFAIGTAGLLLHGLLSNI